MGIVVELAPGEQIVLDHSRVGKLARQAGRLEAERIVMDRVEDIAARLARVEAFYRNDELGRMSPELTDVSALALEIGLISLARVCRDLALTAEYADRTSLTAVWARLVRIGDQSLAQLWELPVLSL